MAQDVKIQFLNHASFVLHCRDLSLLFDPWLSGTAFGGGWGLQYENPDAYPQAVKATHLWCSHFHSDHMHVPTLKRLAQDAPHLKVLSNVSANFDAREVFQSAGFSNIQGLPECRKTALAPHLYVTRFPATGIDNMLLIEAGDMRILNFNDCNIPAWSLRRLVRRMGHIDLLLTSFNHATKLFDLQTNQEIKDEYSGFYRKKLEAVNPRWVIPFASYHYYRAPEAFGQNESLLSVQDIAQLDSRALVLNGGDEVIFSKNASPVVHHSGLVRQRAEQTLKTHGPSVPWDTLLASAVSYKKKLKKQFFGLTPGTRPLNIWAEDLQRGLRFDFGRGISELKDPGDVHIKAHSASLQAWFSEPFGTDVFFIGGDFAIVNPAMIKPLQRLMLMGLLSENRLTPKQILSMLTKFRGWLFFWNRRDEIRGIIRSGLFKLGSRM